MTARRAVQKLTEIARSLERHPRLHRSGRGRVMGDTDDPEGTLLFEISDTCARGIARTLRDVAEAIEERA